MFEPIFILITIIWSVVLPVLGIIWIIQASSKSSKKGLDESFQLESYSAQWDAYLSSFLAVVKTKAEKHLINQLINRKSVDELYLSSEAPKVAVQAMAASPTAIQEVAEDTSTPAEPSILSQPVDNTILLLYFGAFLLVASVGLFAAVGDLSGLARTVIVGITAGVLYYVGLWLHDSSERLAPVGVTFTGVGMMAAPLTGVAWYTLIANHNQAGIIWLVTSLVCLAMYVYASMRVKNTFFTYLLIGSFVSVFESAVLAVDMPTYAYAWGLIAAGLVLLATKNLRAKDVLLEDAGDNSAQLLVPLSVVGSALMLPQFGSLQLAVTLALSGVYYAILAYLNSDQVEQYSPAAQVSFITAIASITYHFKPELEAVGVSLLVIAILYAISAMSLSKNIINNHMLIAIAFAADLSALVLCIESPWLVVTASLVAVVLCFVMWLRMDNDEALQIGGVAAIVVPFIVGQYAMKVELGSYPQFYLAVAGALLMLLVTALCINLKKYEGYYRSASSLLVVACAVIMIPAWFSGFYLVAGSALALVVLFMVLYKWTKDTKWFLCSSIALIAPIGHSFYLSGIDDVEFSQAVALGLIGNILLSLRTREAMIRWVVVVCIVIAPLAIGGGGLGFTWSSFGYSGGYLLAMAGCVLARAIARGKLLVSSNVPLASYYAHASEAYVAGYMFSGAVALVISLSDPKSQIITTAVLGAIALTVIALVKIESNKQIYAFLPLLAQAILLSSYRPSSGDATEIGILSVASSLVAFAVFSLVMYQVSDKEVLSKNPVALAAVMAAYTGPVVGFIQSSGDPSVLVAVSLFIAGLITYAFNSRGADQNSKEFSLFVSVAAVHWFMFILGYTNIHFHTHLLAVFLAGFAYWRYLIGDSVVSLSYVQILYAVVTVPLGLQALGSESGGQYGLILIGEQVAFMVAGITFGQKFLIQAGLWVALVSILYQLRGLGWAFLTLLAVIVIAVAVYRLQNRPPDEK